MNLQGYVSHRRVQSVSFFTFVQFFLCRNADAGGNGLDADAQLCN
jgi:hypothetical protein